VSRRRRARTRPAAGRQGLPDRRPRPRPSAPTRIRPVAVLPTPAAPTVQAPVPAIHRQSPSARPKRPARNRVCCILHLPLDVAHTRHCSAQAQYIAFQSPLQPLTVGTGSALYQGIKALVASGSEAPRKPCHAAQAPLPLAGEDRQASKAQGRTGASADTRTRLRSTHWPRSSPAPRSGASRFSSAILGLQLPNRAPTEYYSSNTPW
jgi:hypothetical protein